MDLAYGLQGASRTWGIYYCHKYSRSYHFMSLYHRLALLPFFVKKKEGRGTTDPLDEPRTWPQGGDRIMSSHITPAFMLSTKEAIGN